MPLSAILFLFLTHLGIGIIGALPLVARDAGVKFFRFNAGLAVALLIIGLAFRPDSSALGGVAAGMALGALVVTTAAILFYWVTVGRALAALRPAVLWIATIGGVATLVAQAMAVGSSLTIAPTGMAVVSFLSSAALLGSSCTAMILGHWYLVLPSLDIAQLQRMVKYHIGSTAVRVLVVTAAVWIAVAGWEPGLGPSFQRYVLTSAGVFFWQRALFGLVGPAVLAYLTWETAKIRSTQSATGILYVDFFTVMVGEVLAKYVHLSTSVPV